MNLNSDAIKEDYVKHSDDADINIVTVSVDIHSPPRGESSLPLEQNCKKRRKITEECVYTVDQNLLVCKPSVSDVKQDLSAFNDPETDIQQDLNPVIKHDSSDINDQRLFIKIGLSDCNDQEPVNRCNLSGFHFRELGRGIDKINIEHFANLGDLHLNVTATTEQTLAWIKRHKLIPSDGTPCPECIKRGSTAVGILKYYNSGGKDCRKGGQRLQCTGVGKNCRKKYSPFTDTIFDGAICRIDLGKVIELLYCWIYKFRIIDASREVGVSKNTVIDYYHYCREICGHALEDNVSQIGGPGKVVVIADSKYTFRKYNKGWAAKPREEGWVFGGLEKNSDKVFMVRIPSRDKSFLIPVIRTYIKPGSVIATEEWKAYNELEKDKYSQSVFGLRTFVSPKDPKWLIFNNELEDNTALEELREGYLQEYLYRKAHKDLVQDFFQHLRIYCRHPLL